MSAEGTDKDLENGTMEFSDNIPTLGMEFDTEEEAYAFYNAYAGATGFSVRKDTAHGDPIYYRKFCCSHEGKRKDDKRDVNCKSRRPETRVGCKAHMIVNSRITGKFQVRTFVAEHNGHSLVSPSKAHMLRSQRKITAKQAKEIDNFEKSGTPPKVGLNYISEQVGGRERVGYTLQDLKNYLRSKRSLPMKDGDAGGILSFLQSKHSEDPNFYSAIQVDEDDLMTNILWVDGEMKTDFGFFGDAVCFDTTYKKNSDGRPFGLFVGVNHHKQTVVFGGALLFDETIDTFMWLFNAFEEAMGGKRPVTIFTDQNAAMMNALGETWPGTNHRLCIWHIYQNAASNLQHVFGKFPDFLDDFSYIIYNYEEETNFDNVWNDMLDKYGLRDNDWLQKLYKKKEKWALAFGRKYFSADILSTQRSESMNSTLKGYVNCKQNLLRFLQNFDRLVYDRRYEELQADFRNNQSKIHLSYAPQILINARDVYTHKVFKLFEEELSKQHDAGMECLSELDGIYQYKITPYKKTYHHTVTYMASNDNVSCNCKKFEYAGILCSHALKVFTLHNVYRIPDIYIKKRWTKGAKRGIVEGWPQPLATSNSGSNIRKEVNDRTRYVEKYQELCRIFTQLTTKVARDDDAFELVKSIGYKGLEEVDAMFGSKQIKKPSAAPTACVVENTIVSKVTKRKATTSLDFDDHMIVNVESMDGATKIGEKSSCGKVIQGLKLKEDSKVKSGKRFKSGLEQAVKKKTTRKNKNSSQDPSQVDTQEKNGHGASRVNVNPLLQPSPLCPPMFSFPQVVQNNSARQPIWNPPYCYGIPPYSSFGQALPYSPTSQPQPQLVNRNCAQRSYQNSTHMISNQPNSGSMTGLLHTQMRQAEAQGSGMFSTWESRHVNDEDNTSPGEE